MSILKIEKLSITLGENEKLLDSSLVINAGDAILLTGKNGSGKSTIVKLIVNDLSEYSSLKVSGQLLWKDTLDLNSEKNQRDFNSKTVYVPQDDFFEADTILECCVNTLNPFKDIENKARYVFDFVKSQKMYLSVFGDTDNFKLSRKGKVVLHKVGVNFTNASTEDKKVVQYLSMNPEYMSGGQKKLANILCNMVKAEFCELCIIDEPLNALDFGNVRMFSNFLTVLSQQNSNLAFLIVSHCRCLPIINKIYSIENSMISCEKSNEKCFGCFGEIDENGLYI